MAKTNKTSSTGRVNGLSVYLNKKEEKALKIVQDSMPKAYFDIADTSSFLRFMVFNYINEYAINSDEETQKKLKAIKWKVPPVKITNTQLLGYYDNMIELEETENELERARNELAVVERKIAELKALEQKLVLNVEGKSKGSSSQITTPIQQAKKQPVRTKKDYIFKELRVIFSYGENEKSEHTYSNIKRDSFSYLHIAETLQDKGLQIQMSERSFFDSLDKALENNENFISMTGTKIIPKSELEQRKKELEENRVKIKKNREQTAKLLEERAKKDDEILNQVAKDMEQFRQAFSEEPLENQSTYDDSEEIEETEQDSLTIDFMPYTTKRTFKGRVKMNLANLEVSLLCPFSMIEDWQKGGIEGLDSVIENIEETINERGYTAITTSLETLRKNIVSALLLATETESDVKVQLEVFEN